MLASSLSKFRLFAIAVALLLTIIGGWLPLASKSLPPDDTVSVPLPDALVPEEESANPYNIRQAQLNANLTSHTASVHQRRASDLDAYTAAETKGNAVRCYFDGSKAFPPTTWTNYDDLTSWGWQRSTRNADDTNRLLSPIGDALKANGIDAVQGKNQYVTWDQTIGTTHGGKFFLPTLGKYGNIYNPAQGLIIAHKNYGPRFQANENRIPASNIPDLQQWSDVVFLEWAHMATPAQLKGLRYVLRYQVQGDLTPDIVRRALQKCNKKSTVPVWPGFTFEPDAVRRGLVGKNKCKGAYEAVSRVDRVSCC